GIGRRLEVLGKTAEFTIIDDYGHHPVEIQASLAAVRKAWPQARVRVVFQPHRYSRTKELFTEFQSAFQDCDELILTDIYAASETPIVGLSGASLAEGMKFPAQVAHMSDFDKIAEHLWSSRQPQDLFITLGAGNVNDVAKALAKRLKD